MRKAKSGSLYECTSRDLRGSVGADVHVERWVLGSRVKFAVSVDGEIVHETRGGGLSGMSEAMTFSAGVLAGLAHAARSR